MTRRTAIIAAIVAALTLSFSSAFSGPGSGSQFGPDGNLPMDRDKCLKFVVKPNQEATLLFHSEAAWENAVVVYRVQKGKAPQKVAERGNHSRSLKPLAMPKSNEQRRYLVSGWHKKSPPDGSKPWNQSPMLKRAKGKTATVVGFEDGGGTDFDDMVVVVLRSK